MTAPNFAVPPRELPSPMVLATRPGPAAELITLSEAARLAGVHRDTVRAWTARGELAAVRETGRREHPLELVARRDFPDDIAQRVMAATGDSNLAGFEALRSETVLVYRDAADPRITEDMREVYAQHGIASLCFVPAIFRGAPLAL